MKGYGRYEMLKLEKTEGILIITLNNPEKLNAITRTMHRELEDVFKRVASDTETCAVILTGAGTAFSSGGDVRGTQSRFAEPDFASSAWQAIEGGRKLISNVLSIEQPMIAALNGDAVGLAATIALFCDIIIMSETARLGDPHVRIGLVAGDGGAVIWPLVAGLLKAKDILLTGRLMKADEAERLGIVSKVVPSNEVYSTAMKLAEQFANGPTEAFRGTKRSLNKILRQQYNLVLDASLGFEFASMFSGDHREAVNAFIEKRRPVFEKKRAPGGKK